MRIIGGFIAFLSFYGFTQEVTITGVFWLVFGLVLATLPEVLEMFMRTQRFIHRDK